MNKTSTVWKITTKDLKSAMSLGPHWAHAMTVTYSAGNWALPNNLDGIKPPLFVWVDLASASRYFHRSPSYNPNWVIWEAEATNVRTCACRLRVDGRFYTTMIYNFWARITRANTKRNGENVRVCDAVKLNRIVDPLPPA